MVVATRKQKWVPLTRASKMLRVSNPTFYRLVTIYGLECRRDEFDKRLRLYDVIEARRLLRKYSRK